MAQSPILISGLREIAGDFDALICDVWGVVHDGMKPYWASVEALRKFRGERGRVVLLSNAPRPVQDIVTQFSRIGVPGDCYDAIVTSGAATREVLASRTANGRLRIVHLGPQRDRGLYEGLNVELAEPELADLVLCTGLRDDETETPEDYGDLLAELRHHNLTMVCANPDVLVPRGGRLVHCAGGLARAYENLGGRVEYFGKPHLPIYRVALQTAGSPNKPLVVGDGLETDVRGANRAGLDALFITHGVHAGEMDGLTDDHLNALLADKGVTVRAAMRSLAW